MITYLSPSRLFPIFLRARRRELGLTPAELATRSGLTLETIERLEQGCWLPSPSQAWRLAVVLELDAVDLGTWAMEELLCHPECLAEHMAQTPVFA